MTNSNKTSTKSKFLRFFKKKTSLKPLEIPSPLPTAIHPPPNPLTLNIKSSYRDFVNNMDNPFIDPNSELNNNNNSFPIFNDSKNKLNRSKSVKGKISSLKRKHSFKLNRTTTKDTHTDNESYTDIYNSLFGDYSYNSSNTSIVSNKENILPHSYELSESKTPNYSITPSTPKLQSSPVFVNNFNFIKPPHEVILSQINENKKNETKIKFINPNSMKKLSIQSPHPLRSLPKTPISNGQFNNPIYSSSTLKSYNDLITEEFNDNELLEEKSLFDALSNVEWRDCSKISLVQYNDSNN